MSTATNPNLAYQTRQSSVRLVAGSSPVLVLQYFFAIARGACSPSFPWPAISMCGAESRIAVHVRPERAVTHRRSLIIIIIIISRSLPCSVPMQRRQVSARGLRMILAGPPLHLVRVCQPFNLPRWRYYARVSRPPPLPCGRGRGRCIRTALLASAKGVWRCTGSVGMPKSHLLRVARPVWVAPRSA